MKRYTKGFTLIELLVVIAIIGILASVVLVSLQSARKKGNDARVISSIQQLRTQLESDYNSTTGYAAGITAADTLAATGNYATLTTDITNQGGAFTLRAPAGATAYALYGRLPSSPSTAYRYFCIDSTGATNPSVITIPNTGTNTCPAAGN
jgi:prepilin-type N-terminal cleavage/methylation domain-containing protein